MATVTQEQVINAVTQKLQKKNFSEQAITIIHRSAEKVLQRTQQDLQGKLKERSEDLTQDFGVSLAQRLGTLTQTWVDNVKSELMIYPDGTKYIHKDNNTTVLVVEQPPQVRTVKIDGSLWNLAMPYVIFILQFNQLRWQKLKVGFTTTSLTSLNDHLLDSSLPNISDLNVCMGDFEIGEKSNKTQQANEIIGGFWLTEFTGGDPSYFSKWQAKTAENPLFVLQQNSGLRNLQRGRLIDAIADFGENRQNIDIVHTLKTEIIEAVATIGAEVQKTILNIDLLKQNRKNVSIENLETILKDIILQAYVELWDFLQSQLNQERIKMQQEILAQLKNEQTRRPW